MVTGVEVAGLTLAVLPLLVNQLDDYIRGIEKVRGMRRYRREYKAYSVGLNTQYVILLNTLEQALEGVVDEEDEISKLITEPRGAGWKEPSLQSRLHLKLGRNYDVFLNNMTGLWELLRQLSERLEISATSVNVPVAESSWDLWKLRKILSRPVYDDLLAKIDATNTILKTLIDQSDHRERTRMRRQPWNSLLHRCLRAHKHVEGLYKTIIDGKYWLCRCKERHYVHLQLRTNILDRTEGHSHTSPQSQFRMIFSNSKEAETSGADTTCPWTWTEVVFEPWQASEAVQMANLSLCENSNSHQVKMKPKVRFETSIMDKSWLPDKILELSSAPPIRDFCSTLHIAEIQNGREIPIGFITNALDSSLRYTMHAVKKLPKKLPQKPLQDVLPQISRRDRLHIASGLAYGVMQFHSNWLKSSWDSSDVHLTAGNDSYEVIIDDLYFSYPLSKTGKQACNSAQDSEIRKNLLLPLGISLVELSLGKSLSAFLAPEDEDQDTLVTKFRTASRLVKRVYLESGTNYVDAVNSCLCWSGINPPCNETRIEKLIFKTVMIPLLRDLVNFEGLADDFNSAAF